MDVNVTAIADQTVEQRAAAQQVKRAPAHGFADHKLGSILLACHAQKATRHVVVDRGYHLCAQLAGQGEVACQARLFVGG